jgi:hypothetical protein
MRKSISQTMTALTLAGALLAGAVAPVLAGPIPGNVASLGKTAGNQLIDVRWHGGHWHGGGIAAGIAAGLIGGAIIGATAAPYYYGPDYYGPYAPPPPYYPYDGPVYAPPVVYAPPPAVVYAPPPGPNGPARQCWVATDKDRGYGYWRPC